LQSEEAQFYAKQIQAYDTAYKNFSEIQGVLDKQFAPILSRGPNQMGFSPEELTALRTQATEGTATEYNKAQRALQENQAARGGAGASDINITAGGAEEERAQLAGMAASTASTQNLGITEAGYSQGYNEWQNAVQGEENLAAGWNPNSFAGSADSSAKVANDEANTIAQQSQAMWGSVLGALGGVAGMAVGNMNVGGGKGWSMGNNG
jgi:hypothetical protein